MIHLHLRFFFGNPVSGAATALVAMLLMRLIDKLITAVRLLRG
jgi:hypothetical protein